MAVVKVFGLPSPARDLKQLAQDLRCAVSAGSNWRDGGVTVNDVAVFFARDPMEDGLGEKLICEVGLPPYQEITPQIRRAVAAKVMNALGEFAAKHVRHCKRVQAHTYLLGPGVLGLAVGVLRPVSLGLSAQKK